MKIYSLLPAIASILLQGCFTIPGKDRIVQIDGINEDLGCIKPLNRSIEHVEYVPADQTFYSKVSYINQCMINYSHGQGWNNRQYFEN